MQSLGRFLLISLFLLSASPSPSAALSDAEVKLIVRRQLLSLPENVGDLLGPLGLLGNDVLKSSANLKLKNAYVALQAWKNAMYSDPFNTTANWVGADVCAYQGVFCAPDPEDPKMSVVAGIDLNHANIAGYLPAQLGFLTEVALFHINSNRFCGIVPDTFSRLNLLHELDISNNRFVGPFPEVLLSLPSLKFLDLRFNDFEGTLPPQVFEKGLDALFLNDNLFTSNIPENLGNSPVSVLVLSNNKFTGHIPKSIGNMSGTLNEILFSDNHFEGPLPSEIGELKNLKVLDFSKNKFYGPFPESFAGLVNIEQFNVGDNDLSGIVPGGICQQQSLLNFTFANNYFRGAAETCRPRKGSPVVFDAGMNCFEDREAQKPISTCDSHSLPPASTPNPGPTPATVEKSPAPVSVPPRVPCVTKSPAPASENDPIPRTLPPAQAIPLSPPPLISASPPQVASEPPPSFDSPLDAVLIPSLSPVV